MNKQTQHTMFSSASTSWQTPKWLFDLLHKEFRFTLDVAASKKNALCKRYITKDMDLRKQNWCELSKGGAAWMNPPYKRGVLSQCLQKAYFEGERIITVSLVPARVDTVWWFDFAPYGEVRFLKGRIKFLVNGEESDAAPFPSALIIFGPRVVPNVKFWDVSGYREQYV